MSVLVRPKLPYKCNIKKLAIDKLDIYKQVRDLVCQKRVQHKKRKDC